MEFKKGDKVKYKNEYLSSAPYGYENEFEIKGVYPNLEFGKYFLFDYNGQGSTSPDRQFSWEATEQQLELVEDNKNNINKMEKFYRVKKDTYMWLAGCILSNKDNEEKYKPVNDFFNVETDNKDLEKTIENSTEQAGIVENSPEWFERVYKVSSLKGASYVLKAKMRELASKIAVNKDGEVEVGEEDKE